MKHATFFLALALLIPLFATPSLSSFIVDDTLVYDAEGNPLQKGVSYIISPPIWGPLGGPVQLARPNGENETCEAADVVQSPFDVDPGTPFSFTPTDPNEDAIKLGYPVGIESPSENLCTGSTIWKVSSRVGILANIITAGGSINTPSSCLRITKPREALFPNTYMFEQCPNLCGAGPKICYPIGIHVSDNKRHLSPKGGSSFEFILLKASKSAVA